MNYTIFFSWQSENAAITDFIRNLLSDCCFELSKEFGITIEVKESDTDNRGSYNINAAVINGIENADIIVADLTPTSHGQDGRANPNSNSLYEYAFACAKKGFENVIAIVDVSQDSTRNMPFDWNHNALVTLDGTGDTNVKESLRNAIRKIVSAKLTPTLYSATTTFFAKRISESFPGVRGLREYTDPHEIKKHLDNLFRHPITFGEVIDDEGDHEPIWWFRGGSSESIGSYRVLKNGIYLIGGNEFKIKRIIVFECHQRYYSEYIYFETEPLPPVVEKSLTEDRIKEITQDLGHCDEEYAVVKSGIIEYNISGDEYDDGYADINGEIVPVRELAERRCRFLSPFNFVVCAKFSSINCSEFDRMSQPVFDGILKGDIPFEELHKIIIGLPKPQYRGK